MTEDDFNDVIADDSKWTLISSRFQDPLDVLAQVAPDEPFVQEMLAQRDRIDREYKEILASVPEGLTRRERDEYVSARVMGAIATGVGADPLRFVPADETEQR